MRRGILAADRGIEAAADDNAVPLNHGSDRDLSRASRLFRKRQRRTHEVLIRHI
jgi:hypothetical protein